MKSCSYKKLAALAAVLVTLMGGTISNVFAFNIDRGVEGYWWQPELDARRGWSIQYLKTGPEVGQIFITGFVYDADGNANWVTGNQVVVDGQFEVDINLILLEGGLIGPGTGTPVVIDDNWANLNIVFNSCSSADFTFSGDNANFEANFDTFLSLVGGAGEDICVYQKEFTGCPAFSTPAAFDRTCILSGTYTEDMTLTNDTLWVLSGGVFIGNKAGVGDPVTNDNTLYIEAGTRIVGSGGADALIISRGSRIIAEGQPYAPIVFTGSKTASEGAASGDWGGLVINGAAPINTCDVQPCEAVGEGDSGAYGGSDPYDDSGVLKYVRVQFAGNKITDEDELNGIAFQGVGSGTVVDYVQVHRNADDGIEFFGGTVNAKHLILTDIEDDSLDWTQGYQGKIQYVLVKQIQDDTVDTDRGMELDNLEQNNDATPRSGAVMANFTILGKAGKLGINPRRGTGGNFSNFIVTGFANCIDIDSTSTFTAAGTPSSLTGVLTMENTIVNCPTNFVEDDEGGPDPWSTQAFFDAQPGNMEMNPMLNGVFPPDGAIYLQGFPLDPMVYDDFFEDVDWIGAFRSSNSAWHYNWSEFLQ
jgi:hypothetical protein